MGLLDELMQAMQEASGEQPERSRPRPRPQAPRPPPEPEVKAHYEQEHETVHRLVPDAPPAEPAPPTAGSILRQRLGDPQAMRDAMVLRTVLGPPLGLKGRWRRA